MRTATDMWRIAVSHLRDFSTQASRAGDTTERIGYVGNIDDIGQNFVDDHVRDASPVYACAELLWYLAESPMAEMILAYAPSYKRFIEADGTAHGHYGARWRYHNLTYRQGPRLYSQIDALIQVLTTKPDSRQAILSMWRPEDLVRGLDGDAKDIPCTLSLQFLLRPVKAGMGSALHLITTMRSNDVWLGMPYDVFCFTQTQKLIAAAIGAEWGTYQHQVGSLHAYKKDWDKLRAVDIEPRGDVKPLPVQHEWRLEYRGELQIALKFEIEARVFRRCRVGSDLPMNPVLRDAALVCARHWIDDSSLLDQMSDSPLRVVAKKWFGKKIVKQIGGSI